MTTTRRQKAKEERTATTTTASSTPTSSKLNSRRKSSGDVGFETPPTAANTSRRISKSTTAKEKRPRSRSIKKKPEKEDEAIMEVDDAKTPQSNKKKNKKEATPAAASQKKKKNTKETTEDPTTTEKSSKKKRRRSKSSLDEIKADDDAPSLKKTNLAVEKKPPIMDLQVHRLRHLEYIPSPVLAMASYNSPGGEGYMALSREDGSYELHLVSTMEEYRNQRIPKILPLAKISGSSLAVAHSLCFVNGVCVAAGPDATLWVINFAKSQLQSRCSSGNGGIFDLQACSAGTASLNVVAGACQDGSVRLWQVLKKSGKIQDPPLATLPSCGAAVLSLAWRVVKTQTQGNTTLYETVLFAGVADGTIRKYSLVLSSSSLSDGDEEDPMYKVEKHSAMLRMTVENKGRKTPTKVWTMTCLQDGTLIAGNSMGQVQFWNSSTGVLEQSMIQSEFQADVLQLVVNQSETKVFASGVDSRVNCYERLVLSGAGDSSATCSRCPWKLTNAQRPHTHDIKAMALVLAKTSEDNATHAAVETLLTAGVDTKLCSYMVSDFSKRRPQVWYPWPSQSPISTTTNNNSNNTILSMQRYDQVELYQLETTQDPDNMVRKPSSNLIGSIAIETQTNLVASALSGNGQWLALCDATSLFVFQLELSEDGLSVDPQKVKLPKALEKLSVVAMTFHEDTLFVADSSSKIHIVDLAKENKIFFTLTVPTTGKTPWSFQERLPIQSIHASPDGKYLITVSRLAKDGLHVFHLKGSSFQPHWTAPSLGAGERPAAVTFVGNHQLAVATFTNHVYLFDLSGKQLSSWSEQHEYPIGEKKWPAEMATRKDFPVRLTVNPSDPTQLVLVSSCET